jgi:hypothetical protein
MEYNETILNKWLKSLDSYGNRMVADSELPFIQKRIQDIKNLVVVSGDPKTDEPNQIQVDVTFLRPKTGFQKDKQIYISLAHYIRPCLCKECKHEAQYECYLNNCKCCMDTCL